MVSLAPLVATLLLAGCGSTASHTAKPKPPIPAPQSVADLVSGVRSGVIRIETVGCGQSGVGTGFLLTTRLVATVEHVVDGASTINLKRNGRVVALGTVVGADPARDVALVRTDRVVSGYHFRFAERLPRLAEDVIALGFPFGLPLTVTKGAVSGLGRTIPIDGINRQKLVQTDAATNPGNSGGPLLTTNGRVIGLVDLGSEAANGLTFAVSSIVAAPLIAGWSAAPQPVPAAGCVAPQAPSNATPAPPATGAGSNAPLSYTGQAFSILYPHGWVIRNAETPARGPVLDTTIVYQPDPSWLIRIDEGPGQNSASPEAAAAPVIADLRSQPTYRGLGLKDISFLGVQALRWEFTVVEGGPRLHKVDIFFIDAAGNDWALLAQSPDQDWQSVSNALEAVLRTFQLR